MRLLYILSFLLAFFAARADERLMRLPVLSTTTNSVAKPNEFTVKATFVFSVRKNTRTGTQKWGYFEIDNECYCIEDGRRESHVPLSSGDIAVISGHLWRSSKSGVIGATFFTMSVIGHRQLPEPPLVSAKELQRHPLPMRRVRLRGTLKDCFSDSVDDNYVFLPLSTTDGEVCIIIHKNEETLDSIQTYIGKAVEVSGIYVDAGLRRYLQRVLVTPGPDGLSILSDIPHHNPTPKDLHSLTNATPEEIAAVGPCKAIGHVMATWHDNTFLIKTGIGLFTTVTLATHSLPKVGDCVEVVGLPETDLFYLKLVRARWRKVEGSQCVGDPPTDILFKDILMSKAGDFVIDAGYHGITARFKAYVRGVSTDENGNPRLLVEQNGLTMMLDCSSCKEASKTIPLGSTVEATGVCVLDSESWTPNNGLPRVKEMLLVPRSARDILVIARPSWWTPVRLWTALGVLAAVLVFVFIWNRILQFRVERRSRALVKAERASLKSALRIDERTRLAAELHDSVAQSLTVISYQLSAAETALDIGDADTKKYLSTAANTLQSCRTDLRRCIWDLRNNALDEKDFEKALMMTSSPVAGASVLHIRFKVTRSLISDSCAHTVLSIVRELVSNASRHGKASLIRIAGDLRDGLLMFSVQDDGIGFDNGSRPGQKEGHFGLDGASERIKRAGGSITIESTPGKGTHIAVGLPAVSSNVAKDPT